MEIILENNKEIRSPLYHNMSKIGILVKIGFLIQDCFLFSFKVDVALLTVIFPKFVYPVLTTSLTASILLMVAITAERYSAVYYPINYNQVRVHHR